MGHAKKIKHSLLLSNVGVMFVSQIGKAVNKHTTVCDSFGSHFSICFLSTASPRPSKGVNSIFRDSQTFPSLSQRLQFIHGDAGVFQNIHKQ